jgi:hypothetical protein
MLLNIHKIVVGFKMIEHKTKTEEGSGKSVNETHIMHMRYIFLTFSNIVVVELSNTTSACCCLIMNAYFPKTSSESVLPSMFLHLNRTIFQ